MKSNLFNVGLGVILLSISGILAAQQPKISNFRPDGQDGVNVFETPKEDSVEFTGVKVKVGAHFAQQFQMLDHSTDHVSTEGTGQLIDIHKGFNNATANLNLDAQLDKGVRLHLITYLSSRHHVESWVKGGYIQFDALPFMNSSFFDKLMENVTIKIGHMEVNYGDTHFRRTDNGNAMHNPFVGNYIMDAFATEIGGEVYLKKNGLIAMLGLTEGLIKGDVSGTSENRASLLAKLGFDKQLNEDFRLRITGSLYTNGGSARNTLYGGDRTGSRYYYALEPRQYRDRSGATLNTSADGRAFSGRWNPGFSHEITSVMFNPFFKFQGLEFFGTYEMAKGRASNETEDRKVTQIGAEVIYRFLKDEKLFLGLRYNNVSGELSSSIDDASISRTQIGAGWFLNKNILAKLEYVSQEHKDFPDTDVLYNGKFNGLMIEAVIGF